MADYYSQSKEYKDNRFRLQLNKAISRHYNIEELRLLAAELLVDWDSIPGESKQIKILELIGYLNRRKEISKLLAIIRKERPNVEWPGFPAGRKIDIQFNYTATGKTEDGMEIFDEGNGLQVADLHADYFDDGIAFAAAMEGTAYHFYTFKVEKENLTNISEMTISITNMQCTVIDPDDEPSDEE
jgi:hypothetical protein